MAAQKAAAEAEAAAVAETPPPAEAAVPKSATALKGENTSDAAVHTKPAEVPKAAPALAPEPDAAAGEDEIKPTAGGVKKERDEREHLNLVFIGHVDAGKSTFCGQILYQTDQVMGRAALAQHCPWSHPTTVGPKFGLQRPNRAP